MSEREIRNTIMDDNEDNQPSAVWLRQLAHQQQHFEQQHQQQHFEQQQQQHQQHQHFDQQQHQHFEHQNFEQQQQQQVHHLFQQGHGQRGANQMALSGSQQGPGPRVSQQQQQYHHQQQQAFPSSGFGGIGGGSAGNSSSEPNNNTFHRTQDNTNTNPSSAAAAYVDVAALRRYFPGLVHQVDADHDFLGSIEQQQQQQHLGSGGGGSSSVTRHHSQQDNSMAAQTAPAPAAASNHYAPGSGGGASLEERLLAMSGVNTTTAAAAATAGQSSLNNHLDPLFQQQQTSTEQEYALLLRAERQQQQARLAAAAATANPFHQFPQALAGQRPPPLFYGTELAFSVPVVPGAAAAGLSYQGLHDAVGACAPSSALQVDPFLSTVTANLTSQQLTALAAERYRAEQAATARLFAPQHEIVDTAVKATDASEQQQQALPAPLPKNNKNKAPTGTTTTTTTKTNAAARVPKKDKEAHVSEAQRYNLIAADPLAKKRARAAADPDGDSDESTSRSKSKKASSVTSKNKNAAKDHNDDNNDNDEEEGEEDQEYKKFLKTMPDINRPRRPYDHEAFPSKLYRMLLEVEKNGLSHICCFTASGKGFRIYIPKVFEKEIGPEYFRHNNYSSFRRQLSTYGFQRVSQGEDTGAFHHKLFRRGHPELLPKILRTTELKKEQKKALEMPVNEN